VDWVANSVSPWGAPSDSPPSTTPSVAGRWSELHGSLNPVRASVVAMPCSRPLHWTAVGVWGVSACCQPGPVWWSPLEVPRGVPGGTGG
jgi:hypothetical protein